MHDRKWPSQLYQTGLAQSGLAQLLELLQYAAPKFSSHSYSWQKAVA
jgi:hypothetical protein